MVSDPTILKDLKSLAESTSCGGPESPLCWTGKSVIKLPKWMRSLIQLPFTEKDLMEIGVIISNS